VSGLGTLIRKELQESRRTRRLPVVVLLFVALGILSVLTARYLPEILELALGDEAVQIPLPTPTIADAVAELQQNLGQFGALTAIVLAMGLVAWERERGTAAFVLSRPASRGAFITAKAAGLGVVLAIATIAAVAVGAAYAAILFEPTAVGGWIALAVLVWLGLMGWASITFLASTLLRSAAAAAGVGIVALLGLSLLSAIPAIGRFLPLALEGPARALVVGAPVDMDVLISAVLGTTAIIGGSVVAAWLAFRRLEL
jgi:ABC-2 type transport system permease protein